MIITGEDNMNAMRIFFLSNQFITKKNGHKDRFNHYTLIEILSLPHKMNNC